MPTTHSFSPKRITQSPWAHSLTWVDKQIRVIKLLSPTSFALDNLYDELAVMAIIRVLPHSFDDVVRTISGLILDKFDKQSVIQSLRNMDQTRSNLSGTSSAFAASSAPSKSCPKASFNSHSAPSTSSNPSAPGHPKCDFCSCLGHHEAKCFLKEHLMRQHNLPSSSTASPAITSSQSPSDTPQSTSATSASALSSSSFQHDSHTSWNADTGASAHMTCNCHWMRNLKPHCVQIRLADGSVVYSEGVGSVRFIPVVNGQEMAPLEFTNVLYVPALCSNLFSVLYLTLHHHFTVSIEQDTMHFIRDNKIAFQAKTGPSTAAFLVGDTIPVEEFASLSSATTLPLDWDLWHCRLCHHHLAGIRKLHSGNLVSQTFAAFKQFKTWAENVTGAKLGTLRDVKGGEYMSREFEVFCIDHGIQRQHTVRNRPQQNGVAERSNRTMEEGVVSMLYESGMPTAFWGEALATFIH